MTARPSESCPDRKTLAAYARDDLTTSLGTGLDEHLMACAACRKEYLAGLGRQLLVPDVPDCRVVKEIGRGRFGVVYKAWWLTDAPRIVALKVLSSVGDMERARFDREIAVLRHLDAPGIVKCLAAGGSGDAVYFIMDYIDGVHFDEFMKSDTVPRDTKFSVFERVCRTVALAHANGVVHRDLKPRNILIDDAERPHVLDFGICSVESANRSSWALGTLTHAGDVIGTLRYMSPEQAWVGVAAPIGERSDLWSLWIMLYELVTDGGYPYSLEPPPEKSAHEALLERIRKEMPTLPRAKSSAGGVDLRTLLERCLAWEPEKRIESAAVLADDIAAYRAGRRIRTRPLSVAYRVRRLAVGAAARSRWTFAAAMVAAVGVVLSGAAMMGGISWSAPVLGDTARAELLSGIAASGESRDAIVVAGVFDDSVDAMAAFAVRAGLDGVSSDARTWRGVHSLFLDRLARAKPRAVVFDYYFKSPQPQDASFGESILRLERSGIPVVLASRNYDEQSQPLLAPKLTSILGEHLRHGAISVRSQVLRSGEYIVAVRRSDDTVLPTLWLSTLAAVLHPDARLELAWTGRTDPLILHYSKGHGLYRRERDTLMLSRVFTAPDFANGIKAGELVGAVRFGSGDPNAWSARTIPYEQMLVGPATELQQLVGDRIVLVGDLRTTKANFVADRHSVAFRGDVLHDIPGCYLVAEGIAGLLSHRFVRTPFPLPMSLLAAAFGLALIGYVLPLRLALWRQLERPGSRRVLFVGLGTTCGASLAALILTSDVTWVWASVGCFSMTLPMMGSFWVEFARNRHRVAERARRVVENFGFATSSTLTLPRLTSIPEIR